MTTLRTPSVLITDARIPLLESDITPHDFDINPKLKFKRTHLVELQGLYNRGIASFSMNHIQYAGIKNFVKAVAHDMSPFINKRIAYAIEHNDKLMYDNELEFARIKPRVYKVIPEEILESHRISQLVSLNMAVNIKTQFIERPANIDGTYYKFRLSNIKIGEYVIETVEILVQDNKLPDDTKVKELFKLKDNYSILKLNGHLVILPSYLEVLV